MLLVYTKTAYSVFHAPLKIEKLWGILEKSFNFPRKSLNVF